VICMGKDAVMPPRCQMWLHPAQSTHSFATLAFPGLFLKLSVSGESCS
jgi:hypothetical protein